MKMGRKGKLSSSEAVYGFVSWLMRRGERTVMSKYEGPMLPKSLADEFIKKNNLPKIRKEWYKNLILPK